MFMRMVSHPDHILIVDGWCPILVTAPEMQEEKLGIYDVHSSISTLLSGVTRDPGHSTRNARGGGNFW